MSDEREGLEAMVEIMREHDLDSLTVRSGDRTYELVRRAEAVGGPAPNPPAPGAAQGHSSGAVPTQAPSPVAAANYKKVTAPIIGVFYRAAAPGSEPFVETDDRVEVGQVLCIIEAMKLMNEITSDYAGTVRRILSENGALVSLGEEMFWIEP